MKGFSIIVAVDEQQGIGRGNDLPWRLSGDMRHFKEITMAPADNGQSNVVIMGRRTWESLPAKFRPLPGRVNVVLTADSKYTLPEGVLRFGNLEKCVNYFCVETADTFGNVFIIGGARVFSDSISSHLCVRLYITRVIGEHSCDTFFPAIPEHFIEIKRSVFLEESQEKFFFIDYENRVIPA